LPQKTAAERNLSVERNCIRSVRNIQIEAISVSAIPAVAAGSTCAPISARSACAIRIIIISLAAVLALPAVSTGASPAADATVAAQDCDGQDTCKSSNNERQISGRVATVNIVAAGFSDTTVCSRDARRSGAVAARPRGILRVSGARYDFGRRPWNIRAIRDWRGGRANDCDSQSEPPFKLSQC
jgi:hypothetical protein